MTYINPNPGVVVNPTMKVNGKDVVDQKAATPKPAKKSDAELMQEIMAQMQALQAQNAELAAQVKAAKSAKRRQLELRVSAKGAVSLYGLGRFPVTEYAEQWYRIMTEAAGMSDEQYQACPIGTFVREHQAELSYKGQE